MKAFEVLLFFEAFEVAYACGKFGLRGMGANGESALCAGVTAYGDEAEFAKDLQTGGDSVFAQGLRKIWDADGEIAALPFRQLAELLIQDSQAIAWWGERAQDMAINGSIFFVEKEVNVGRLSVATGTTGHLVEFDVGIGKVVEDDVANVGNVDPFAKGAGRYDDAQLAIAKALLNFFTGGAIKTSVVEDSFPGKIGKRLANEFGETDGLCARVYVDDQFAALLKNTVFDKI